MHRPIGELARSAAEAYRNLDGFEASETIRAAAIEVTARVRFRKPDKCAVEVASYRSPLADLEEQLANEAEFAPDELVGMSFSYDGTETWVSDPKTTTVVQKRLRALPEPLPRFHALGEISFLDQLTRDFLVRDAGEESVGGRTCRVLGLKPREAHRSQLLKTVTFPIRRAQITLEEGTLFPTRIRFFPARNTLLASLVGERDPVSIEYSNVRLEPPQANAFSIAPAEGSRVFREALVSTSEANDSLPFFLSLDALLERGYRPVERGGTVAVDPSHNRGYCAFVLATDDPPRVLTLRAGNYLSRNMSRRRATIAQTGEATTVGAFDGRVLNRGNLWAQKTAGETARSLFEVSWADAEVFFFLLGDGIGRDELVELATALALSQREAVEEPNPSS